MKRPPLALLVILALSLLAAPVAAQAQPARRIWRIGHLDGTSPSARTSLLEAFKNG
jgi:hypothetical protein